MSTAKAMVEMLRKHYLPEGRPPAGIFLPEIESPDGKRRADAVWVPQSWNGPRTIVGHEIKVSRADVAAELADATKADAWARFCGQWWLVIAHPSLIDGLDVPEHWGVMSPPSGRRTRSMTVLRPAPALKPVDSAEAFRRIALTVFHRQLAELGGVRQSLTYAEQRESQLRSQLDHIQATGAARQDPLGARVAKILQQVRDHVDARGSWVSDEELDEHIVAAIVDYRQLLDVAQRVRWDLRRLVDGAKAAAEPMNESARMLAALDVPDAVAR